MHLEQVSDYHLFSQIKFYGTIIPSLSVATFGLEQCWIADTQTIWHEKPKIFTM